MTVAGTLAEFLTITGRVAAARSLLNRLLAADTLDDHLRATALYQDGLLAFWQGADCPAPNAVGGPSWLTALLASAASLGRQWPAAQRGPPEGRVGRVAQAREQLVKPHREAAQLLSCATREQVPGELALVAGERGGGAGAVVGQLDQRRPAIGRVWRTPRQAARLEAVDQTGDVPGTDPQGPGQLALDRRALVAEVGQQSGASAGEPATGEVLLHGVGHRHGELKEAPQDLRRTDHLVKCIHDLVGS
jgi:hypothetical protein